MQYQVCRKYNASNANNFVTIDMHNIDKMKGLSRCKTGRPDLAKIRVVIFPTTLLNCLDLVRKITNVFGIINACTEYYLVG